MLRRLVVVTVLIGASLTGVLTGSGDAASSYVQFWTTGNVIDASGPGDAPPEIGAVGSFVQGPVTDASASAQDQLGDDVTIYVRPDTAYYLQSPGGNYRKSDYAHTVVEGQPVRAVGRRVSTAAGDYFVATKVANPPDQPSTGGGGGVVPQCGLDSTLRNVGFAVHAYVQRSRTHVPCSTGVMPGGMILWEFVDPPTYQVSQAIEGFGGRLDIQTTPVTKYLLGNSTSDFNHVVRVGNEVIVIGRFQRLVDTWVFVARTVHAEPSETVKTVDTMSNTVTAVTQDQLNTNHYEGPVTNGRFAGGTFSADLAWTREATEWAVTGTWAFTSSDGNDTLTGVLDGMTTTSAFAQDLDLHLDVTGGSGAYFKSTGGGEFQGVTTFSSPALQPTSFSGDMTLYVIPCVDC